MVAWELYCCSYFLFCVNLLWDLEELSFTQSLGFSRRRCYLHLDDQFSCCHWSLKKNKRGCLYLVVNPRKKEYVDLELARDRISKFYWWVAIRSRAWGLVSLIVKLQFFHSGFKFTLKIARLNHSQVFIGLVSWVIISLCYLSFRCFALYDCLIVIT